MTSVRKAKSSRLLAVIAAGSSLAAGGWFLAGAQEEEVKPPGHADCSIFGPGREKYLGGAKEARQRYLRSIATDELVKQLGYVASAPGATDGSLPAPPGDSRTGRSGAEVWDKQGLIDTPLFSAMRDAQVRPAEKTNDFEFIRRATLDLTGRIPAADRVAQFVTDTAPDKRARLVEELLASDAWVDKWTMFFGDHLKNTLAVNTQGTLLRAEGRNAMYEWIKSSLASGKSYAAMVQELIAATGGNSWTDGRLNWMVGGRITGGPVHDIWDGQAKRAAEMFLGLGHMDCLLCHSGRGHLDELSLWGRATSRQTAWGFAAFFSRSTLQIVRVAGSTDPNYYYWAVNENPAAAGYRLNTTTGNRPARQPVGTMAVAAPLYPFSNRGPANGEHWRQALGREITSDFQFARATVNFIWKEFFNRGIVEPLDQFDPARLDPDNPPAEPGWGLQPSNAKLLHALAQRFREDNFDLKKLMRLIVNSEAYQLSSRYPGTWNPSWEPLFARHLARRLTGEELADALALSSNIPAGYTQDGLTFQWAMQSPEPFRLGGAARGIITAFLPGNRDDEDRRPDLSSQQMLSIMNDNFVIQRTRATGTGAAASLLQKALPGTDEQLVNMLFLNVLSRVPTEAERTASYNFLRSGNRTQKAQSLLWSLYNKVDFVFNY
jgi:hypothetical protein